MRHASLLRRSPRHRLDWHRPARRASRVAPSARTSDLILAVLGVALLGGVALMAAAAATGRLFAP